MGKRHAMWRPTRSAATLLEGPHGAKVPYPHALAAAPARPGLQLFDVAPRWPLPPASWSMLRTRVRSRPESAPS
jgi:hypothetical protein